MVLNLSRLQASLELDADADLSDQQQEQGLFSQSAKWNYVDPQLLRSEEAYRC